MRKLSPSSYFNRFGSIALAAAIVGSSAERAHGASVALYSGSEEIYFHSGSGGYDLHFFYDTFDNALVSTHENDGDWEWSRNFRTDVAMTLDEIGGLTVYNDFGGAIIIDPFTDSIIVGGSEVLTAANGASFLSGTFVAAGTNSTVLGNAVPPTAGSNNDNLFSGAGDASGFSGSLSESNIGGGATLTGDTYGHIGGLLMTGASSVDAGYYGQIYDTAAVGASSITSGIYSTIDGSFASGESTLHADSGGSVNKSFAAGSSQIVANGGTADYTAAVGESSITGGNPANHSVAMGKSMVSAMYEDASYSTALGESDAWSKHCFAAGKASASYEGSSAIGYNVSSNGDYSMTLGAFSTWVPMSSDPEQNPRIIFSTGTPTQSSNAGYFTESGDFHALNDIHVTGRITMPAQGDIPMFQP